LTRGDVPESLSERKERSPDGNAAPETGSHIAGKETRLMALALLKGEKEEGAILEQWPTERTAVLGARVWWIGDRSERVTRLETPVPEKAEKVSLQCIRAAFGYHIDYAT
jgi:hypothetical protein